MIKKIGKIIAILGALIVIIGIIFALQKKLAPTPNNKDDEEDYFEDKKIEEIQTEEKTTKEINELVDALFKEDVSKEELEKITGTKLSNYDIFYGKDSYLRTIGNNINGLDEYKTKQNEYINSLETKIKDNSDVQIKEYIVSADGAIVQNLTYKTYYYDYFINDYNYLVKELIKYTNIDLNATEEKPITKEEKEKIYKIQIKALEIMSNYFDDYKNESEIKEYQLIYRKDDKKVINNYFSLLINLSGKFYKNKKFSSDSSEKRIKKYIEEAISSSKLDVNNPYQLID